MSSKLIDQQTVVTAAIALLPPDVRIIMHAESEFRSQTLVARIRSHGWDAMLGIRGNVTVTTDPAQAGRALEPWLTDRDTVAYRNHVWLTEDHHGPVHVLAGTDRNDRNELIWYAIMTNLPATWQTDRIGSWRIGIETMVRDWQSGGFELGKTAITDRDRFHRLIILVCLIYLWFVSVGRWIVKRGYRHLLDAGPADAWQRSLFTLAIAWQNRCRTFDQAMAVFWLMYD